VIGNISIKIIKIVIIVFEISFMFWEENIISKILIKVNNIKISENLSNLNVLSKIIRCFILNKHNNIIVKVDK